MTARISLTRYLVERQREDGLIPGNLRLLLEVVARACKSISHAVNKGALGGVLGSADTENVQGEMQKKLDIIANEVLKIGFSNAIGRPKRGPAGKGSRPGPQRAEVRKSGRTQRAVRASAGSGLASWQVLERSRLAGWARPQG